jgi:hypothetical protein
MRKAQRPWCVLAYIVLVQAFVSLSPPVVKAQMTLNRPQPRLMTESKWSSLTERQHGIYIRGFLETVSFFLYSQAQPGNEHQAQAFSDWTLCAERQPLSRWRTLDWGLGELDNPLSAGRDRDFRPHRLARFTCS